MISRSRCMTSSIFAANAPGNRPHRRTVAGALLWLLLVLWPPPDIQAKLEDRIVAIVNSDLIMLSDVKRELMSEQDRIRQHYQGSDLDRRLKVAEYVALTKMIERQLQLQAAKTKGIEVTDQEVSQAVEEARARSSVGERFLDVEEVRSSILLAPTTPQVTSGNAGHHRV